MTAINTTITDDIRAIKALIQAFFDSINAADTKALASHFFPSAGLTIIRQDPPRDPEAPGGDASTAKDEKLTVVIRTTIEQFVKLIDDGQKRRDGQPPGPVIHEWPELDITDIKIDALFAVAWSPFKVTFDGALHHYGTMVFTLGKTGSDSKEWKIEGLTQNYRRAPGWPETHDSTIV
ncbi:hypothetical protein N0V82_006277 [Gnomoniopsis sp. IMI 355080]|nr:hypothetical protein N0V82_006277 [Gnomoniopsis sp. IMI 355080]